MIHEWKGLDEFYIMKSHKLDFLEKKHAYFSVSAIMFCKHCLAYTVHIDWCYHAVHKHSSRSRHISVLTTCTYMFRQVCTIEPSFFKTDIGDASSSLRGSTSSL